MSIVSKVSAASMVSIARSVSATNATKAGKKTTTAALSSSITGVAFIVRVVVANVGWLLGVSGQVHFPAPPSFQKDYSS